MKTTTYRDVLYINVSDHKTAASKQASIAIEKKDQENFLRYVAILKRFKQRPTLAFPFLSPSKGFIVSTARKTKTKNKTDECQCKLFMIKPISSLFHVKKHTNIYRRLNSWAREKGKEKMTCTRLRKAVETTVDLYGTSADKELVASGLQHSARTAKKYYRVQSW